MEDFKFFLVAAKIRHLIYFGLLCSDQVYKEKELYYYIS